jgi:hypothetical protein
VIPQIWIKGQTEQGATGRMPREGGIMKGGGNCPSSSGIPSIFQNAAWLWQGLRYKWLIGYGNFGCG